MTIDCNALRSLALVAGLAACGPAPAEAGAGPLAAPTTVPARTVAVALALEAAVDGARTDLAPDLWYGVSDRLTLGLTHSHRPDGLIGAHRGVCLSGCLPADGRYQGLTLAAHFPITRSGPRPASASAGGGGVRLVGIGATEVAGFGPAVASLVVGGVAEWRADGSAPARFWAQAGPRLAIGLLGRAGGNRERASAHVTVGAALADAIDLELGLGVGGPATADFFAGAQAPVWTQLVLRPQAGFGVGVAVGTSDALGHGARRGYVALTLEVRVAT